MSDICVLLLLILVSLLVFVFGGICLLVIYYKIKIFYYGLRNILCFFIIFDIFIFLGYIVGVVNFMIELFGGKYFDVVCKV